MRVGDVNGEPSAVEDPARCAAVIYPSRWRRPPLIADVRLRWAISLGVVLYLVIGIGAVDINWARLSEGWERGLRFLGGFAQPDLVSRWDDIREGLLESLTMTLTATVIGVVISIPVGIGAARNIAPAPVYLACRGLIAVSRSLQEIIVAILFVAMVGFGPLAGFLTLAFATIGFLAKLLAEDIEDIDAAQVEAIRATGAGWWQVLDYGIRSQVTPRLIGLSLYRLDINFRESAVIGIVGAGGVGATLNTALDRYEYDSAAAILILIIAIVLVTEYVSGWVRGRVQ